MLTGSVSRFISQSQQETFYLYIFITQHFCQKICSSYFVISFSSWMTRLDAEEAAFQCSDDVYDMKICHDSIICGLRNGTVEIWNKRTMKKEFSLEEQQGSVLVDANDDIGMYVLQLLFST